VRSLEVSILPIEYNFSLVVVSVLIAIVSSAIALYLMDGVNGLQRRLRLLRILAAGLVFATGVWAMHFVGMLACQWPISVAFDTKITIGSYGLALLGAIPAMLITSVVKKTLITRVGASVFLTVAICGMHYYGMASMRLQPAIEYESHLFILSIVIAFVASYTGIGIFTFWNHSKASSTTRVIAASLLLGGAVSAMHYTGMASARIQPDSISLASIEHGIAGIDLVYAVISSTLLIFLLLLFTLIQAQHIAMWKVLLIVAVAEGTVMLVLPLILPENTSGFISAGLDVGLLTLLLSPVAWRVMVTAEQLQQSHISTQKTLETQKVVNQLLSLPINALGMESFLTQALDIVQKISWLNVLPQGAIFLNDEERQCLVMKAQKNLHPKIQQACTHVQPGQCLCGLAASRREIQFHSHVDHEHTTRYTEMPDHGHYIVPLLTQQKLQGVLCLYLMPGHEIQTTEVEILKTIASVIADLIATKRMLEEINLANTVFEHNLDCLMLTDADNNILKVNPVFTQVTGYTTSEILGKKMNILKSEQQDGVVYQKMKQSLQQNNCWEGEFLHRRKNGEDFPVWLCITAVCEQKDQVNHYVVTFADISATKETQQRIHQLAYFDSLTGLPNRTLFYDRLKQVLAQAKRQRNKVALLFIDLDRFKEVNDTLGHDAGDELLKTVAGRVSDCLRETDTLARLGGDEFVVLLSNLGENDFLKPAMVCRKVADHILHALSKVHHYEGHDFYTGASIGIIIYPDNADNLGELLKRADTAMYEAKNAGRNTYRFFSNSMAESIQRRVAMERELRKAIVLGELTLVFQPLIDINEQDIIGAEALLRWHNPLLGNVSPADFIPLAEETGLINEIGFWVIEQGCRQLQRWNEKNLDLRYLAINVSIHQLIKVEFIEQIISVCENAGVRTEQLELEITEGGLALYPDEIEAVLHGLRQRGFKLAIDDFGTDYSSLSRLKSFNVNVLKIDRSFVQDMTINRDDKAIVKAVIELADALELTTLAEGIETSEQLHLLKEMGCQRGQGYLLGKPMAADLFSQFYELQRPFNSEAFSGQVE